MEKYNRCQRKNCIENNLYSLTTFLSHNLAGLDTDGFHETSDMKSNRQAKMMARLLIAAGTIACEIWVYFALLYVIVTVVVAFVSLSANNSLI